MGRDTHPRALDGATAGGDRGGRRLTRTPSAASASRRRRTLRAKLLGWYRASRRDLPWRRTRDPYAIWISESMLQQTRVETVLPYYGRFLARFPDVASLAGAELEQVLQLWTGLGYYSRARNLHRAARELVARHGGRLPDDAESLRELPGIGRYTAGAIASIAFDRAEPIVDGNVARVLSRLCGIREEIGTAPARRRLWDEAAALADGPEPGALNQALMELGATLCTPRAPRCGVCPMTRICDAKRAGDAESLPRKAPRARAREVQAVAGFVLRRGRALAVRRPERGLLAGLWELPGGDVLASERPGDAIARTLGERVGLELAEALPLGEVEHAFTHLSLRLHVFRCRVAPGRVRLRGPGAHRWLAPRELRSLPQGGPTRKALALAMAGDA